MSGLDESLGLASRFLTIVSIVGGLIAYYRSVRRALRKDQPSGVRSRRIAFVVLHTIALVGVVTLFQLWNNDVWPDDETETRWIVGFMLTLFFGYAILGVWSVTDEEYNASREEEFEREFVELGERQAEELKDAFLQKIAEDADQEELQKFLKKEERRRKREKNRLLLRFIDD